MPRFIADAMLGKLARWMRAMGYDVEYDPAIEDDELLARALSEGRLILTRDTRLMERRAARGSALFISGDSAAEQLRQVAEAFAPPEGLFLTRCLRCNAVLEDVPREQVRPRVPEFVYETQGSFSTCPLCGRVYWAATHRQRMIDELARLLG